MPICKDVVDNIMEYIDNELDNKTLHELESHLDECPECRSFVATYRRMLELSGNLRNKKFVTPEIWQRLKQMLKSKINKDAD